MLGKNHNDFEKDFFKLMINAVFRKTMENVRKHRDIKLVTTEPNYRRTNFFSENLLEIEIRNTQILMSKPVYLGLSILELSKIVLVLYKFWYDYVKPKYSEKAKLCYMDTDSFIVYIKTDDLYKDITEDVETRFDNSNYKLDKRLPNGINKKAIGLSKDKWGG